MKVLEAKQEAIGDIENRDRFDVIQQLILAGALNQVCDRIELGDAQMPIAVSMTKSEVHTIGYRMNCDRESN